ncbi:remorin 4.2-like isoform X2 [Salvia miltiorrhiza]|uniref:remorin 4.2-like isoform X2 n=1 Tax=Salvia miltiorrhiza TaxID=226208 RepID=UPI0025ACAD71|nr:remorin 4.2-like isoform X2 [Salvia miltiorrhiza]
MSNDQRALTLANALDDGDDGGSPAVRDIHALTPPRAPRAAWETGSHRSSSLSTEGGGENFSSMSREFNALVLAGATIGEHESGSGSLLGRIREEGNFQEETNPLAIVPDTSALDPVQSPRGRRAGHNGGEMSVHRVKKEEVESKIHAWQNAKVAKINNRFKREDAIINGWEGEQVQKATSWMKKVEYEKFAEEARGEESKSTGENAE